LAIKRVLDAGRDLVGRGLVDVAAGDARERDQDQEGDEQDVGDTFLFVRVHMVFLVYGVGGGNYRYAGWSSQSSS